MGNEFMSPEEITLAFIRDFKEWNDYAISLDDRYDEKSRRNIGKTYDEIILKYCRESLQYQPLAYTSDSGHDPEKEKILSIDQNENETIVYTRHEKIIADVDLSSFYEYRFEKEGDRWYLVSVVVVINDERYESL
jgi:hypothetical protein